MKILAFDLRAFGPFADVSLDLAAGDHGLHLIYGANEAGKSSALRALTSMFFGIPGRSADDFLHPKQNLRVGATLRRSDGATLGFLRRKGNKNTLLRSDNATLLEDGSLRPFLGDLDGELFGTMFALGHEQLVRGGKEIASGSGSVGQVLFAAGSGIADLQAVQADLDQRAGELFAPRGQTRKINQTLRALDDARKRIRQGMLPIDEWESHEKTLTEAKERFAERESQLRECRARRNHLERIERALPAIARRKEYSRQRDALGDVTLLPATFAEERRKAMNGLEMARKAQESAQADYDRLKGEIDLLVLPESLLAQAEAIDALPDALGSHRKAQRDLPRLEADRDRFQRDATEVLCRIRPDLTVEGAESLRLTNTARLAIQRLGNRYVALGERLEQARQEIDQTERKLATAQSQVSQLPLPGDASALKDALRRTQTQGELENQLADAEARLAQAQAQVAVELARLPGWSGALQELEARAVPAAETVDHFAVGLAEVVGHLVRLEQDLEVSRRKRSEVQRQGEELQLQGEVPTEDDLARTRQRRDLGWQLVRDAWREGPADPVRLAEFFRATESAADAELADVYAQAVEAADEISDRLRREATRVAQRASLIAQERALDRDIDVLEEKRRQLAQSRDQLVQEWNGCWKATGVTPRSPVEMQAWLGQHRELVQQAQAIRAAAAVVEQIRHRIETYRRLLLEHLVSMGISVAEEAGLASLVQRSQALLDELDDTAKRRAQLEHEVSQDDATLSDARAKAQAAERDLQQWQSQWAAAIAPLGLMAEATPEAVQEVIQQTEQFFARRNEAQDRATRIASIASDARQFRQRVRDLAEQMSPDLASRPEEQAADQMIQRLRQALADRQRRESLLEEQRRHAAKRDEAQHNVETLSVRLAMMCREARCQRPDELSEKERASEIAARLDENLAVLDKDLAVLSAGGGIDALVAESLSVNADELPGQVEHLAEEIARLEAQRVDLLRTTIEEEARLRSLDSSTAAAEAAEESQELLVRLEADAMDYVRLRLASAVLREGIERYRKKNEAPVLRRAGELFRRLTRGSFQGLAVDFDDNGDSMLKGVRPDGASRVELSGMSEGAADQLYFALRLASLESYLDGKEPIPLVIDDVLISFDDDRSSAALEILAEFSEYTQVIFFTHHTHLVRLAQGLLSKDTVFVHDLRGSGGAS